MGVSKFQYFSTVPLCDVDGCVCLKRGGSSHFFALSCQHSQFLMFKVTAEWYCKIFFCNRYAQQGLIHKRLNKVCDSFEMLCSNCSKPLRIFAVRERVGNKVIWWQVSVENVKMPLWVEKTSCKELEMLFSLYLTFLSSSDESTHIAGRCVYRGRPRGWKDGFVGGGLLGIWNSWWKWVSGLIPPTEGWSYHCFLFKHIASHWDFWMIPLPYMRVSSRQARHIMKLW